MLLSAGGLRPTMLRPVCRLTHVEQSLAHLQPAEARWVGLCRERTCRRVSHRMQSVERERRSQAEQVEDMALSLDDAHPEAAAMLRNLFVALGTRTATSEAVGMLRERYGLDSDRAFEVMLRVSGQDEVKVRVVADRIRNHEAISDADTSSRDGHLAEPGPHCP